MNWDIQIIRHVVFKLPLPVNEPSILEMRRSKSNGVLASWSFDHIGVKRLQSRNSEGGFRVTCAPKQ
jgi:hypothetical protein